MLTCLVPLYQLIFSDIAENAHNYQITTCLIQTSLTRRYGFLYLLTRKWGDAPLIKMNGLHHDKTNLRTCETSEEPICPRLSIEYKSRIHIGLHRCPRATKRWAIMLHSQQ